MSSTILEHKSREDYGRFELSEKEIKFDPKIKPQMTSVIAGNSEGSSKKTTIPEGITNHMKLEVKDEVRHHAIYWKGKPADLITKSED